MALGKGKQYREEINFIRKTAIAMQQISQVEIGVFFMHSVNVIHGPGVICQIHDLIN